ncbi:MAG: NAD-dependent isocitrate dehydrogenase [Ramalina farinacea]|uniref:NAD-dependent isocitrate dehydrogenase n=1 Tax=Ramalina farinacea TaxID=258253 RepID=A0AA43QEW6_9LECA|nr:NAD-dependent isocitrate dehydrogenase [Ramalina farinacea]
MIGSRCVAASARQSLRRSYAPRQALTAINQIRCYAIPVEDKVAKFKGQKGSDVLTQPIPQQRRLGR